MMPFAKDRAGCSPPMAILHLLVILTLPPILNLMGCMMPQNPLPPYDMRARMTMPSCNEGQGCLHWKCFFPDGSSAPMQNRSVDFCCSKQGTLRLACYPCNFNKEANLDWENLSKSCGVEDVCFQCTENGVRVSHPADCPQGKINDYAPGPCPLQVPPLAPGVPGMHTEKPSEIPPQKPPSKPKPKPPSHCQIFKCTFDFGKATQIYLNTCNPDQCIDYAEEKQACVTIAPLHCYDIRTPPATPAWPCDICVPCTCDKQRGINRFCDPDTYPPGCK